MFVVISILNLVLIVFLLSRPSGAGAAGVLPVIRGRALEIVDEQGRVRASITVYPADPKVKMPDGTSGYPETVLLRLVSSQGRPNVKIAATERGSAVAFGGEADPTSSARGCGTRKPSRPS